MPSSRTTSRQEASPPSARSFFWDSLYPFERGTVPVYYLLVWFLLCRAFHYFEQVPDSVFARTILYLSLTILAYIVSCAAIMLWMIVAAPVYDSLLFDKAKLEGMPFGHAPSNPNDIPRDKRLQAASAQAKKRE